MKNNKIGVAPLSPANVFSNKSSILPLEDEEEDVNKVFFPKEVLNKYIY